MSANFYNLLKYAATGISSPGMTYYDKMKALAMTGGGTIKTLTGIPPLSFTGNGSPLISWSMLGNGQQTGTPSPDNIIMPTFCGKLVGADWTIPITCAGQTVPVYLGQTQTARKIKKLVLTGEETFSAYDATYNRFALVVSDWIQIGVRKSPLCCSHYQAIYDGRTIADVPDNSVYSDGVNTGRMFFKTTDYTDVTDFKQYLVAQYAAGTPVTVWYVLAEPETAIVNEPLAKIGDYADELHSTDAGVSIPTAKGENVLTVDTDLQPSSMTITGHIK